MKPSMSTCTAASKSDPASLHPESRASRRGFAPQSRLLELQRRYGNRAVGRLYEAGHLSLLQRQTPEEEEPVCRAIRREPLMEGQRKATTPVQAKLALSSPQDASEQEAERVAEEVAALSNALGAEGAQSALLSRLGVPRVMGLTGVSPRSFQGTATSGRSLRIYARGDESASEPGTVAPALEARILQSRGSGQVLPAQVRNLMALRTGYDFSAVRVKTDSEAAELSRGLNARAFTLGSDIWLGRGESPDDIRLMAHELTHVVQQGGARPVRAISTAGLETLARKGTVMGYLQALTRGTSHDVSLYAKEIARFAAHYPPDRIAELQRQILERPAGAELGRTGDSKVMRDCGCSGGPSGGGPAPCAVPTNFRETLQRKDPNGVLHFEYAWDSSTGSLADLSACEVGERVDYAPYNSPPFGLRPNPTIIWLPAKDGRLQDNHSAAEIKPYSDDTMTGTQYYRYHCPCSNGDSPVNLLGPITITRRIILKADSNYKYRITKSGLSNEIDPMP